VSGHVFISYSHKDAAYVGRLRLHLTERSIQVWTDEGIPYGAQWARTIEDQLRACAVVLPVMSPNSRAAEWVGNEILLALSLKKPILPLLLAGERFMELLGRQDEDVTDGRMPSDAFVARVAALSGLTTPATRPPASTVRPGDRLSQPDPATPVDPPTPGTPAGSRPRADGLYCSKDGQFLRFYPDGHVSGAGTSSGTTAEQVAPWLSRSHQHSAQGVYRLEGDRLEFALRSANGVVDHTARISSDGRELDVEWRSHINGNRDSYIAKFEQLPLTG
jgi:TIR domain